MVRRPDIRSWAKRRVSPLPEWLFLVSCWLCLLIVLAVLLTILGDVVVDGLPRLGFKFLTSFPSRRPEDAGIFAAWVGTVYVMVLTAVLVIPVGVGAAIYLEEFSKGGWLARLIELNISNLAGVPGIVYGLLGLQLFARWFRLGESLLAGALTLSLVVLPVVVAASREALRSVPRSIREAALALGATPWETVRDHVLPLAFSGILTGSILALSRAIGEAAPLITIGALTYVAFLPRTPLDPFTVLPIQAYNWLGRPQPGFAQNAAAAIIVLMIILLLLNAGAIVMRNFLQKKTRF